MKYKLEMLFFYCFKLFTDIMPRKLSYKLATLVGILSYKMVKKRRDITLKNLKIAFPEYSDEEIKRIAIASYINMSKNFFEMFWNHKLMQEGKVTLINEGFCKELYDQKKGILLVSLHLGNWEMGAFFGFKGYKMSHIVKRQKNPLFDAYINKTRSDMGVGFIYKGDSPRKIITALKEGSIISMLSDQYVNDVEVTFFGQKTKAPSGAALLSLKYHVPVVFGYGVRNSDNTHNLTLTREMTAVQHGTLKESIQYNTQRYIDEMEKVIRENPEQWLWQHNRWKER